MSKFHLPSPAWLLLALMAGVVSPAPARTWSSTDGRQLEGDYVSGTPDAVTVKLATGQTVVIPLNRLSEADQQWVAEQKPGPKVAGKPIEGPFGNLITGDWALSEFGGLPFALFAGKDMSSGQKLPLILALHGKSQNNDNGKQVSGWMKSFSKAENYTAHPCIIVAPLCYQPFGGTGGGWHDKPGEQALALVKALLKSLPIDSKRVYIIGHSMGGFGTCDLMARQPRLFAAGIPVSGFGDASETAQLQRKPLWLHHAADDKTVAVDGSRAMAKLLERSKPFKYTEYPTGGHGIPGMVFDDPKVRDWLFEQGLK